MLTQTERRLYDLKRMMLWGNLNREVSTQTATCRLCEIKLKRGARANFISWVNDGGHRTTSTVCPSCMTADLRSTVIAIDAAKEIIR